MISDNYFEFKKYPHNFTTNVEVTQWQYSARGLYRKGDISNIVVDYSYSCSAEADSELRQTASLTLYTPKSDLKTYYRRETLCYDGYDPDTKEYTGIYDTPLAYHIVKTYLFSDGTKQRINLGYFVVSDSGYSYDSTTSQLTLNLIGMSACFTAEYGGALTTTRLGYIIRDEKTHEEKEIQFPVALSIEQGVSIDPDLFRFYLSGDTVTILTTGVEAPINSYIINELDIYQTPKIYDFDNGCSMSDIITTLLDDCLQNYCYYIDESCNFVVKRCSPTMYGECMMLYRDYGELVIDENTDTSESDFANYIEVYGKDGNYYGFADWSKYDGGLIRKKSMDFSELQSDDECYQRAKWEAYKARYGHETTNVTIADNYIPEFNCPTNLIGKCIEYRMMHGDTHVFTLKSLSFDGNTWKLGLSMFRPFYLDAKTDDKYEGSQIYRNMLLAKPIIAKWELVDGHIIRLYVTGDDIDNAVVKIYKTSTFLGETVTRVVEDGVVYKVFDYKIKSNRAYMFQAQLYNSVREPSLLSDTCTAVIDSYVPYTPTPVEDPYPHPIFDNTKYLTTGTGDKLTDSQDNNITI